jgi:hypothetical protein
LEKRTVAKDQPDLFPDPLAQEDDELIEDSIVLQMAEYYYESQRQEDPQ